MYFHYTNKNYVLGFKSEIRFFSIHYWAVVDKN